MADQSTILLIEDNDYNLHIAKELLERAGYQTLEAQDADTGIQLAKAHHPELILMDMYMPSKDGYEATQILKADPQTQDIIVVAFTALAMPEDRKRAETVGCAGVISKPIIVDTFAETVTSYFNHKPLSLKVNRAGKNLFENVDPEFKDLYLKLSHDMQAPIRKIQQFCDYVRSTESENLSPAGTRSLDSIERAAQQMQGLLEDFLSTTLSMKKITK